MRREKDAVYNPDRFLLTGTSESSLTPRLFFEKPQAREFIQCANAGRPGTTLGEMASCLSIRNPLFDLWIKPNQYSPDLGHGNLLERAFNTCRKN